MKPNVWIRKSKRVDASKHTCVMLHDSVSMSLLRVRPMPRHFMRLCLALLGICSAFSAFFGFFELYVEPPAFYAAVIMTAVVTGIGLRARKLSWLVYVFGAAALLLCILRYHAELLFGAEQIFKSLVKQVYEDTYLIPRPDSEFGWTGKECVRFTVTVLGMLISFIVTAATVRRPSLPVAFLATFMLVELGLFYGMETKSMAIFGLVAYWVSMAVMAEGEKRLGRHRKSKAEFVYSEKALYAKPGMRFMPTELVAVFAACLVLLLGGIAHYGAADYRRSDEIDVLRGSMRTRWDAFLEQMEERIQNIGKDEGDTDSPRTEKQLNDLGNPAFSGGTAFSFTLESDMLPNTMYLKQNTYSVYTGNSWKTLPDATYAVWEELLSNMHSQKALPQAPERRDAYEKEELAVLTYPLEQSVYQKYLPYRACYDSSAKYIYDTQMLLADADAYTYRFVPFDTSLFGEVSYPSASADDLYDRYVSELYTELYRQYDSFVRVNYQQVSAGDAMNVIREDAAELIDASYDNMLMALFAIRAYLGEKAVYTLEPAKIPEGVDFASYFLTESREGYCVHYATAAVLLCRMMGIPARYAEGYVVFEGDFSDPAITTQDGNQYTVNVPDSRAHAWAEVYLPGYGWLPFEFTAGYAQENHTQAVRPDETETTAPADTTTTTTTTTTVTTTTADGTTMSATDTTTHISQTTTSENGGSLAAGIGTVLLRILLIAVGIALTVILYLLLHRGIYVRRENRMNAHMPNTAATASYRYLLRVLARENIVRDPMQSHEDFALAAEAACPLIPEGAMQRAVETQLAVTFSQRGITREQAGELSAFVQELVGKLYEKASPLKRFMMRWVYHDIL